jgi:hypothetical protein
MGIQDRGAAGGVIGAIAVVVDVICLAMQIRQDAP